MCIFKKKEDRYEKKKLKQLKKMEKYNQRQEEYDAIYKNKKQKSDFKSLLSRLKFETYTKRLVGIVVIVALIDLQLTYILAFMDKIQIAETLSTQICVTLLGTILVYVIRAYFDTKAEKRDEMIKSGLIIDKKNPVISNDVIKSKIQEVIDSTGLAEHINTNSSNMSEPENPDDSDIAG